MPQPLLQIDKGDYNPYHHGRVKRNFYYRRNIQANHTPQDNQINKHPRFSRKKSDALLIRNYLPTLRHALIDGAPTAASMPCRLKNS